MWNNSQPKCQTDTVVEETGWNLLTLMPHMRRNFKEECQDSLSLTPKLVRVNQIII